MLPAGYLSFSLAGRFIALFVFFSLMTVESNSAGNQQDIDNPPADNGTNQTLRAKVCATVPLDATNKLDNIHDGIRLRLQRRVDRFDHFFAKNPSRALKTPDSRFRLGTYLVIEKEDDNISTTIKPEFEADLSLPNLEDRWSIFIKSVRGEDLPGLDPKERKSILDLGLQRVFDRINLHAGVSARWQNEPVGIAKLEWRPDCPVGKFTIYPRQKVFYESKDGLGEITSLTINRWIGNNFVRLVSAGKWTEQTSGVEWEQTVTLGHAHKLIEERKCAGLISIDDDIAQGIGLRYSIFGHNSTEQRRIDRHRITLVYRYPMYKNWMFFMIAPGIEWRNDDEWDANPSIQFGLDTLFWEVVRK